MLYATGRVNNDLGMFGIAYCMNLVERFEKELQEKKLKKDYLLVIKSEKNGYIVEQEQPPFKKEFEKVELAPNFQKLWLIDDGSATTLLYPSEY